MVHNLLFYCYKYRACARLLAFASVQCCCCHRFLIWHFCCYAINAFVYNAQLATTHIRHYERQRSTYSRVSGLMTMAWCDGGIRKSLSSTVVINLWWMHATPEFVQWKTTKKKGSHIETWNKYKIVHIIITNAFLLKCKCFKCIEHFDMQRYIVHCAHIDCYR